MVEELKKAYINKISELLDKTIRDAKIQIDYHYDTIPTVRYDITEYIEDRVETRGIEDLPSAQPEQRWIPCSERLPEDDTEVIVSCTDDSGDSEFSYTTVGWHFKGIWVVCNERSYFVRAWMPLPEAWKGEQNG